MAPLSLFPSPTICGLGIAEMIQLAYDDNYNLYHTLIMIAPLVLFVITLAGCGSAIICAIYYRFRLLTSMGAYLNVKKWIIPMAIFHMIPGIPIMLAYSYAALYPPVEDAYPVNMRKYTLFFDTVMTFKCGAINASPKMSLFLMITAFELVTYACVALGMTGYILHKWIKQVNDLAIKRKVDEEKIQNFQKQLTISLLFQVNFIFLTIYFLLGPDSSNTSCLPIHCYVDICCI